MTELNETVTLSVKGMTCNHCASQVSHFLYKAGAEDIEVDLAHNSATFLLPEKASLTGIVESLNQNGYPAALASRKGFQFSLTMKFFIAAVFTLPMLLHMIISVPFVHDPLVQLVLSLPVMLIGVFHFGTSAYGALKRRIPNMDVLISIGAGSAFIYSLYGLLTGAGESFLFFETAASIITFVLAGNLLEEKVTHKTTSAIRELKSMQRVTAKKVLPGIGRESIVEVDSSQVEVNDTLFVTEGDKVPVDGTIIKGELYIDESLVTGESLPVVRQKNDTVIGGTVIVGGSGYFRADSVGSRTILGEIIRLVKQAQEETTDIQRLGDVVSAYFVPAVCAISLITFLFSLLLLNITVEESLLRAIAVLVISCPCAMGLATPTAVVMGVGLAAREGILIKGGATLEQLAKIQHILMDKTGTLTSGDFTLTSFEVSPSEDKVLIAGIIKGLEQHSSHPLARSLVREFPDAAAFTFVSVQELKGRGVSGESEDGTRYEILASWHFPEERERADLVVTRNDEVIARLQVSDKPRPSAAAMVKKLKDRGMTISLLSGDRLRKCEEVANTLGIEHIYAEQSPADKLSVITAANKSAVSAFVGDGINDAPALSRAAVGIAIQGGSHTAIQSARVILLSDNLENIPRALKVADQTLRTIKQNLFWAFFYNVLAIPVAAAGYLSPMIAAFAMAFSDLIVVGNSLYLRRRINKDR